MSEKQMVKYLWDDADRTDPRWYENHPAQCETKTATVWTLHMHIPPSVFEAVLTRASYSIDVTGEYEYGNSWISWGEKSESDDDKHLGIYFKAENPERAKSVGNYLAAQIMFALIAGVVGVERGFLNLVDNYAISTAGDWAEIIDHNA